MFVDFCQFGVLLSGVLRLCKMYQFCAHYGLLANCFAKATKAKMCMHMQHKQPAYLFYSGLRKQNIIALSNCIIMPLLS